MTRPLIADRKRDSEAARWHREVFEAHGRVCHFCPKNATDAMHVIPRASLGKLRYTMPKENGRPGCRACHEKQERGELFFAARVTNSAIRAHNKIAKVKIHHA
jgi:hypothetical protein